MVDPTTPSTAFAATYKHGLYKTTDAGRTWRYSGIGQGVRSVAVDPQSTSTVYAGTWRRGLYKSTDGGDNWQIIGFRGWGVLALAFDPRASTTLYAGTEKAGVWRSTDGGAHWTEKNSGGLGRPPYLEVRALAIDRLAPDTLYVSIGYGANRLFKSTDGGDSWRSLRTGLSALALDPRTPSVVYAASTYSATYKSTNGGRSWRPVAGLKAPVQALLITQETGTIYAGTSSSGVFVSADHGLTWRSFNRGLDIRRSSKPGRTIPTVNALSSGAAGRLLYAGTAGGGVFGASFRAERVPLLDPRVARELSLLRTTKPLPDRPQVSRAARIYLAGEATPEATPGVGRRPAKPRPAPQIGLQARAHGGREVAARRRGRDLPLARWPRWRPGVAAAPARNADRRERRCLVAERDTAVVRSGETRCTHRCTHRAHFRGTPGTPDWHS